MESKAIGTTTQNKDQFLETESIFRHEGGQLGLSRVESQLIQQSHKEQQKIKEYESKIAEMGHIILKLSKQNEQQKHEFKELNEKLNRAFEKLSPSRVKIQSAAREEEKLRKQQDVTRKELENEIKKNRILKKELDALKQSSQLNQETLNKGVEHRNSLTDRDREIKELKQKLKGFERAEIKEKTMPHFVKEEQLTQKLHQLSEENNFQKKKVSELKLRIDEYQKEKQKAKAQSVEKRAEQTKNNSLNKDKQVSSTISKELHEKEISKLNEQIKVLEYSLKVNERRQKQQNEVLRAKVRELTSKLEEVERQLKNKEKELFIVSHQTHSMRVTSRIHRMSQNKTIDVSDVGDKGLSRIKEIDPKGHQFRQQFLGCGGVSSQDSIRTDDLSKLDLLKSFSIKSLTFICFEECILSLETKYQYDASKQEVKVTTFQIPHSYANVKAIQVDFEEFQYIKEFEIFTNKNIELIRFRTSRKKEYEVGNQKNYLKCKHQQFSIKSFQKPIGFGAVVERKKVSDKKGQYLTGLCLVTKKKQSTAGKAVNDMMRESSLSVYSPVRRKVTSSNRYGATSRDRIEVKLPSTSRKALEDSEVRRKSDKTVEESHENLSELEKTSARTNQLRANSKLSSSSKSKPQKQQSKVSHKANPIEKGGK